MLDTKYNHLEVEKGKYENWKERGYFNSGDKDKMPFTIVIPPPNVTGKLHLGHAWDTAIQDATIRLKRMQGFDALWLPGMDHAAISTEAKVVAKGIMKMNDAIDDLADNFDDWKDVLKKSTKGSEEYSKALKGTQKAVSNLLDVSEDYVSDDFIVEHLNDIEKAATGDAEAIDNLKAALAKDIIANIVIENGLDENARAEIIAAAEDLQASIPDIKVGASIDIDNMSADEAAFLEQCNKIIADANMTAE